MSNNITRRRWWIAGVAITVAALAGVANAATTEPARSGPPFSSNNQIRMIVKYYEGMPLNKAGDRACLYNDGNSGCWNGTSTGTGNCTIGWGHKLHDGPCDADDQAAWGTAPPSRRPKFG